MKDYDPLSDVARHLKATSVKLFISTRPKAYGKSSSFRGADTTCSLTCVMAPGMKIAPASKWCRRWNDWASPSPAPPQTSTNRRASHEKVCHFWGIKAPAYVLATDSASIELSAHTLKFPLIAKHPNSYSSIGLTRDSRVETPVALHEQAEKMIAAYGATLIEEFIEGREFSVLVVENADDELKPFAYRPLSLVFPAASRSNISTSNGKTTRL